MSKRVKSAAEKERDQRKKKRDNEAAQYHSIGDMFKGINVKIDDTLERLEPHGTTDDQSLAMLLSNDDNENAWEMENTEYENRKLQFLMDVMNLKPVFPGVPKIEHYGFPEL
ncbi:hypothetical protein FQA39_LY15786 [Lamprigera yunnana]|nr:hypothetical protein FQA39_LY15786 [Lamprigera yunnana]